MGLGLVVWRERERERGREVVVIAGAVGAIVTLVMRTSNARGLQVFRSALFLGVRWSRAKRASSLARLKIGRPQALEF